MPLAGIKYYVGENRNDLFKFSRPLPELIPQFLHLRPKPYASHAEITLESLLEIVIQFFILSFVQFKIFGNMNRICRGFTISKKTRKRLQGNFMGYDPDAFTCGNMFDNC